MELLFLIVAIVAVVAMILIARSREESRRDSARRNTEPPVVDLTPTGRKPRGRVE